MRKRIAMFAGLLAALVASMGFAVAGTGAYFTDQESGSATANAGHVKIGRPASISATFSNMRPGEDPQQSATLWIDATKPVDVYARSHKSNPNGLSSDDMAHFDAGIVGVGVTSDQWVKIADDVNGGPLPLTLYAHLDISASNGWQDQSASVDYDVLVIQNDRKPDGSAD